MSDNYEDLFNADVFDQHGTRVGPVGQVYLDDQTGAATWATVKTGLFGLKETFVPLAQAVVAGQKLTVPYDAQLIKDAPRVDPDKHLDAAEEAELYTHYGITNVMAAEHPDPATEQDHSDEVTAEAAVDTEVLAAEQSAVDAGQPTDPVATEVTEPTPEQDPARAPEADPTPSLADVDLYGEVKDN